MKNFSSAILVSLGIVACSSVAPAMAGNAASSLGDCYNHVISACNQKSNVDAAHACANSGMNACDKEHKATMTQIPPATLKAMRVGTLKRVRPATTTVRIAN